MLSCSVCKNVAAPGEASCGNCKNGFVSQLSCCRCGVLVPRGLSECPDPSCAGEAEVEFEAEAFEGDASPSGGLQAYRPPLEVAVPLPQAVPNTYKHGRHGVDAVVQLNGNDAAILTMMVQAASMLLGLAQAMNKFQGVMPSTRAVIKASRNLAADLQEEVEVRRGPQ